MEILLYIAIGWLLITTLILLKNLVEFKGLNIVRHLKNSDPQPLVSICIPARNEEITIERCITSILKQDYPNFEILVLNDQSSDQTGAILDKLSDIINNLHHLKGEEKPDNWLGKPWACHQLSRQASGDILVFLDADVWLQEQAVSKTVKALSNQDTLTVWPRQITGSFWERMTVPLIYLSLYTLLPSKYVERKPRWMPAAMYRKLAPSFAAACGQFIAFNKSAYEEIGGHLSVKKEVVEDVALARRIRAEGLSLKMYHGMESVGCRMYHSHEEVWNGLRKNFLAGFNGNIPLFLFMAVLHLLVYVFPVFALVYSLLQNIPILSGLSLIAMLLIYLQRILMDIQFRWNPAISLLHPVSVLWFQLLGLRCLWDYLSGNRPEWKGRKV